MLTITDKIREQPRYGLLVRKFWVLKTHSLEGSNMGINVERLNMY